MGQSAMDLVKLLFVNAPMIGLLLGGFALIYLGIHFMQMHKNDPKNIPKKLYTIGAFTLSIGIVSIILAFIHFFFNNTGATAMKVNSNVKAK